MTTRQPAPMTTQKPKKKKTKKPKIRHKPYEIKGSTIEIYSSLLKIRYPFILSEHAKQRMRQRNIHIRQIAKAIWSVAHMIPFDPESKSDKKIAATSYQAETTVLIKLGAKRGVVLTVLEYPGMGIPTDCIILDQRFYEKMQVKKS